MKNTLSPSVQELIERLPGMKFMPIREFEQSVYKEPMPKGMLGLYDSKSDVVALRHGEDADDDSPPIDFVALHEIIHWTGHISRCARPTIVVPTGNPLARDTEEMTAHFGMRLLAPHFGCDMKQIEYFVEKFKYIHPWADLAKADRDARKAYDFIIQAAYGYQSSLPSPDMRLSNSA